MSDAARLHTMLAGKVVDGFTTCTDPRDRSQVRCVAEGLLNDGWTYDEVVVYLSYSEEVSPWLDEATGVRMMTKINEDVKRRLAKR